MDASTLMRRLRLLAHRDRKSNVEMGLKLGAEAGELCEAVLVAEEADGTAYRGKDFTSARADVREECADVLICVAALVERYSISNAELLTVLYQKSQKWESVTGEGSDAR